MPNHLGLWNAGPLPPDEGPGPGTDLKLDLPADGELADAASVNQAFMTLANHTAWLHRPTSFPGTWEAPIIPYRTARGHKGFHVDHFGMPAARVTQTQEDFALDFVTAVSNDEFFPIQHDAIFAPDYLGPPLPGWQYLVRKLGAGTAHRLRISPPVTGDLYRPHGRSIFMVGELPGDRAIIRRVPTMGYHARAAWSMEWDARSAAPTGGGNIIMGLVDGNAISPGSIEFGTYFLRSSVNENWQCVAKGPGGLSTVHNTGFNSTSGSTEILERFRIVWLGSAADDYSASRVLFFINDEMKVAMTTTLPEDQPAWPFFCFECAATPGDALTVGAPIVFTNYRMIGV